MSEPRRAAGASAPPGGVEGAGRADRLPGGAGPTSTDRRPGAEVARILAERARALARPLVAAEAPAVAHRLVAFSRAADRYAVDASTVLEVVTPRGLTPLPGTPPTVLGVIGHRGEILAVIDIQGLWRGAGEGPPAAPVVVVVEAESARFGIAADQVEGMVIVDGRDVGPAPAGGAAGDQPFITGVFGAAVAILDPAALARDRRVSVADPVSRGATRAGAGGGTAPGTGGAT